MLWKLKVLCVVFIVSTLERSSAGVDLLLDTQEPDKCEKENVFLCENERNQCIPASDKCDGVTNCDNGRDEEVALCGCLPTEFQCNSTTCINKMQRCDTRKDCEDGKDEQDCDTYACPAITHIKCGNNFCVSRDSHCDFKDDCMDNSDEKFCSRRNCTSTEFRCNNSQCVNTANLCDGIPDCLDGSDEVQATCDKHFKCLFGFYILPENVCDGWNDCYLLQMDEFNCSAQCNENEFRCPNSQCINSSNVCDGICDCVSCVDEDSCTSYGCIKEEKFLCRSENHPERCIDKSRVCDGRNDCKESFKGRDEFSCTNASNCNSFKMKTNADYFYCPEGRCIPKTRLCDYYIDCLDGDDEKNCSFRSCTDSEFTCHNRQCIPKAGRCNVIHECNDWSDEMNCETFDCPANTTKCKSGHCVRSDHWCDYRRDCPDGSDEHECESYPCGDDEFRCESGQCIHRSRVCYHDRYNERLGCADNSHLLNCSAHVCRPGEFKCRRAYCIDESRVCDGYIDCPKPAPFDESNCAYPCPVGINKCVCILEEMNCENKDLHTVPRHQEEEHFTKLIFSGNRLNLTNYTFSKQYYDKITFLDLRNASLTDIPIHLFDTMWQLTYLHLGDNNLTILRNGTFIRLSRLRQLELNGNKIQTIEEDTFMALLSLTGLDLSNQRLTHLYKNMFKGLKSISLLNLSANRIQSVENGAFNTLVNVKFIDLSKNRIIDIQKNVFLGLPRLQKLVTDSYQFCCLSHPTVDCLPEPDEFSSCEDLMSNEVLRVSIWVLGIIAMCGNLVVIMWRVRDFRAGKVHSFLITNLAIGDFLMGVYLLIIAAVDTHYRGVYNIHDKNWRESDLCQFAGFISTFSSELSVLTLTTITLDRLLCILFPLKRTRLGLKQAMIVMGLIWCLVFLLATLPLMGFSYFEGFYGRSGVCLALHVTPERPPGWEYSVGVFLVLNFISFLLIAFSYLWMFSMAKKTRSAVRTAESKTDNAMARRMTLIVMTDFCCWIPIIVLGFVSLAGTRTDIQVYAWIAVFVLPLNSATNPIIYTLSTAPFLGNVRKRVSRLRKSFIHSFTTETKHSYVDERSSHSYCERKSPYRQLELMRLRSLNSSPPLYSKRDMHGDM